MNFNTWIYKGVNYLNSKQYTNLVLRQKTEISTPQQISIKVEIFINLKIYKLMMILKKNFMNFLMIKILLIIY